MPKDLSALSAILYRLPESERATMENLISLITHIRTLPIPAEDQKRLVKDLFSLVMKAGE